MFTPALPQSVTAEHADLVALLRSHLRRVDDLAPASGRRARTSVRQRVADLHRRRRRLRHALGSGTLAAGVTAGSVQHWLVGDPGTPARREQAAPAPGAAAGPGTTPAPADATSPTEAPVAAPTPAAPATSWTWDPVEQVDREAADPGPLYAEGRVHVYTTSAGHCTGDFCLPYRVPRFESDDLSRPGRLAGDAMPERPLWVDAADDAVWAPAVARVGDRYVMWFAATSRRPRDGGMKCTGAAVSATPEGPFAPEPEPLHCTPGFWAIDPYPVAHEGGWTLLWRQDEPGHVTGTIAAAPLRADGLALAGPRTTLITGKHPWEDGYPGSRAGIGPIENPAMARHPATGEWLLTWSANLWETRDYATGLAVCDGPMGPCRRTSTEPWLRTNESAGFATSASLGGAGGLSFLTGPDGALHALLHAYRGPDAAAPAPRVAWAYRVDAAGAGAYRLIDIARNRSVAQAVNES